MKNLCLSGFVPPHELSHMAENTPILIALSGGADSSALLALLAAYADQTGAPLSVAHIDHKLRGKDSDADREFCRALAEKHGLPFYLLEADVKDLATAHRRSIEEEARHVRYAFFSSLMREHNIPLLATAHNADDNAETVLFNLTRGSGLRGLCGIPQVRDVDGGKIIRPLLGIAKSDILTFCEANNIAYVTDRSNSDVTYARNRIRHTVLPELRGVNGGAVSNISRLCNSLRRDEDFLEKAAEEFLSHSLSPEGTLPLSALKTAHPAISARAVATMLSRLTSNVRAVHIDAVLALTTAGIPHSSLDLCDGVRACIEDQMLILTDAPPSPPAKAFYYELHEGQNPIPEADMLILIEKASSSHKNQKTFKNIYKKSTTICISSDRIYDSFSVQPRREGDVILSGGMHKKVKKLMCDRKIPITYRDRLPVFHDSKGIIWIPGVAIRDGADCGNELAEITLFYN